MNYKADNEYELMYIDDEFNEHNYTLKPDEDMNTPQVILELQANCADFFKLVEDDSKLQEDYINLDAVQSLQARDKNVVAYEMDLYLDTDGDRYRLLKSYANMLDRKPSILWVGFSDEEVADLTPNLGDIDDTAKKFGYKYNMQVATDNLDYNEVTHKLNNITNDVAIGGNWLYIDDIHRIAKEDIRNKAVQNMLYENKKLSEGVEAMDSELTESEKTINESIVRRAFRDMAIDVLQGAKEDGTIKKVTDELVTKCVDALEDADELYDLIIGIVYDTIENGKTREVESKYIKTEAKEYTCIEDRQGGDWAVGDTMTAEEWGERAAGWAYDDNWDDSDEPLLKNFKTEQDCIDYICDIWEITIVPSTDPRAQEFLSECKQTDEIKRVTEEVVNDMSEIEAEYKRAYGKDLDLKRVPCIIARDTYLSGWGRASDSKAYQVVLCGDSTESANIEYDMKRKASEANLANIRRAFGINPNKLNGTVSFKVGRNVTAWNTLSDNWYNDRFNTNNN